MWLVHPMISDKYFEIIATMALMAAGRGVAFMPGEDSMGCIAAIGDAGGLRNNRSGGR
jgi:hypothetical protein